MESLSLLAACEPGLQLLQKSLLKHLTRPTQGPLVKSQDTHSKPRRQTAVGEGLTHQQKRSGMSTVCALQPLDAKRGFARHSVAPAFGKPNATKGDVWVLYSAEQQPSSGQGESAAFKTNSTFSLPHRKTCGHYCPVFPTDLLLRWHLLLLEQALG